ncbi:MAG: spermidine/putrescine ABC transporter substrate-binding protein [Oscillospiraceae bacterium]|jgi:spermidine/putrescine transport system substrate-binding protein|nr:spermidine/putrescine ABC transporter substrate-binding protein [Oscillospiraceae bacterium]
MKKIFSVCLCLVITLLGFAACAPKEEDKIVRVLNLGEYIADGSDELMDVLAEFEKRTGISCEYSTVPNNEALYAKLKGGGVDYDVIVTSDYMLERMIDENMLQKLNYSKITNWGNIYDKYKKPSFDPRQQYTVPYNVGMVGLIYNSAKVTTPPTSWNALWNPQYAGKILMFNNPRDTFAIAQSLLGYSFNTTDRDEWTAAAQKIKDQKPVRYGFVDDEIFDKMQNNETYLAPWYAGDFYTMAEINPDLRFVYPKEGVNSFIDSFAILSDAKNVGAAHKFIDFMLEPDVALANAEYLCYASPNKTVVENTGYTWYEDEILYPSEGKYPKTEDFKNLPQDVLDLMNTLWDEVKR